MCSYSRIIRHIIQFVFRHHDYSTSSGSIYSESLGAHSCGLNSHSEDIWAYTRVSWTIVFSSSFFRHAHRQGNEPSLENIEVLFIQAVMV